MGSLSKARQESNLENGNQSYQEYLDFQTAEWLERVINEEYLAAFKSE